MEFSSIQFYSGKIKSAPECLKKVLTPLTSPHSNAVPRLLTDDPVVCINTENVVDEPVGWIEDSYGRHRSYFNQYEAAIALAVMDDLRYNTLPFTKPRNTKSH